VAKVKELKVKGGKKPLFPCTVPECTWESDGNNTQDNQERGLKIHTGRMHAEHEANIKPQRRKTRGPRMKITAEIKALAEKQGVRVRTIVNRIKRERARTEIKSTKGDILTLPPNVVLRERLRPPKDFFDVQKHLLSKAAQTTGAESDAFLEAAALLMHTLRKHTK